MDAPRRRRGATGGSQSSSNLPSTSTVQNVPVSKARRIQEKQDAKPKPDNPEVICTSMFIPFNVPDIWQKMFIDQALCDCIIYTSDKQIIHTHKTLFAAASPIFRAHLKDINHSLPVIAVKFPTIDSTTMNTLLEFVYTGRCEVTIDKALPVLEAATLLQMNGVLEQCTHGLTQDLNVKNCVEVYKIGKRYFCEGLLEKAFQFLLHHFGQLAQVKGFKTIDFQDFESMLRDDRLNATTEEEVFKAITNWVEFEDGTRKKHARDLLQCIRFGLMNSRYFDEHVVEWEMVKSNPGIQDSLYEAVLMMSSMPSAFGDEFEMSDPLCRPRIPYEIIFAIGGWNSGRPTELMESYDIRADRWFLVETDTPIARAYHDLVCLDNMIYMIGGFDGTVHYNTTHVFDPIKKTWTEKSCMHQRRCYVSCCALNNQIYALGGYNGTSRMFTAERYTPTTNQWEMLPNMSQRRSDAACCEVNGKVYVIGGFTGSEILSTTEMFNPETNQWTNLPLMLEPRSGLSVVSFNGYIYALGGFNGTARLATVIRLNLDPDKIGDGWEQVHTMLTPRSNFCVTVIDNQIIAIGGFNGVQTINLTEVYNCETGWRHLSSMALNRSALKACVCPGLSNVKEYSYVSKVDEIMALESMDTKNSVVDQT